MSDVPEGYRMSEVGVIPEEWGVKIIGDFTSSTAGGTPSTLVPEYWNGNIRWMSSGELNLKKIHEVEGRITEAGLKNSSTKIVPLKCILIGLAGKGKTRGTTAINYVELCTNQSIAAIFPNDSFIPEYLFYNIDSRYKELRNLSTGDGGRGGLNLKIIKGILVPLPTKTEQQAIASALSDVDALITALEQLITKKRNIKQGAMQQLLTGEKRLPGFEGEWEVKTFNKIADVRDGTHESPKYHENGVIFITSKNIIDGNIDFTDINFISEDDATNINQRSKVDKGDILMSMIGTIGNAVLINFEPNFCIKNVALIKPSKVSGNYLIKFLQSQVFQKCLNENLDGGIQKFISLGRLRELNIPIPFPAEQQAIAQILSDMNTEIESLEQKRNKYKAIKQGMMQELLTGKTRLV